VTAHTRKPDETQEAYRERRNAERRTLVAAGKCPACGRPNDGETKTCARCRRLQFDHYQPGYRAERGMDPALRRCGICRAHGHNRQTCHLRAREAA
jgi:hypothetical protein